MWHEEDAGRDRRWLVGAWLICAALWAFIGWAVWTYAMLPAAAEEAIRAPATLAPGYTANQIVIVPPLLPWQLAVVVTLWVWCPPWGAR